MLMTLAVSSLRNMLGSGAGKRLELTDVPDFAIRELGLRGLNIQSSMLSGWSLRDLDRLRDRADKAACPCLVLIDDSAISFVGPPQERDAAVERVARLAAAATRLGCSAVGLLLEAPATTDAFDQCVQGMKHAMNRIERMELNLLLAPHRGLTDDPVELTELIKKIGGFRIGSLPSFSHASNSGDAEAALKRLAPYAGTLHASILDENQKGTKHKSIDLAKCVEAIQSVGYVNTLALEYLGHGDPIGPIEQARNSLSEAIEALAES